MVLAAGLVFWRFNFSELRLAENTNQDSFESLDLFEVANNEEQLEEVLREQGPEKVMEKLLADSGNGYELDCHNPAHEIGRAAYHIYKAAAFGEGSSACHSGFYHGAMEGLLIEEGTANISGTVEKICNDFKTSFGIFECLHGVGHGVMAYENYDLARSLELCGELTSEFNQRSCYGGAFMENIVAGQGQGALGGHDTEWLSDDPHYPCNGVNPDEAVQQECYKMQTSWMLNLHNYNFEKAGQDCLGAPQEYISTCFLSLGRDAAGHTLRDPQKIKGICSATPFEYRQNCLLGGLNVIIDFFGEGLDSQASELCKIVDGGHKQNCYQNIATRARGLFEDKEKIKAVCSSFEEEYKNLCS